MNKKKLFIGSIIAVLGTGVGVALYTVRKNKKAKYIKIDNIDEEYEREYTELKRQK
jgi:hypothetical protein